MIIPHPMLHKRNFVLIPLFEIDPNWIHPKTKKSIKTHFFLYQIVTLQLLNIFELMI